MNLSHVKEGSHHEGKLQPTYGSCHKKSFPKKATITRGDVTNCKELDVHDDGPPDPVEPIEERSHPY